MGRRGVKRIVFSIACLAALPAFAADFERGQRWSCVTDQGAEAYLAIHAVDDDKVLFSWGVLQSEDAAFDRLCNKRAALSFEEIGEFCRLLGDEASEGHVRLREGCSEEG